jgi:hypothetical protein
LKYQIYAFNTRKATEGLVQQRFCASGADEKTSAFNRYWASVNRLDKFLNRPGKLLSSPGGQALLVPGLALWLIKNFVSLQRDGQADVILIPRLTQSRFVSRNCYSKYIDYRNIHLYLILISRFGLKI